MLRRLFVGRLLQAAVWFFNHLSWVTHPDRLADAIEPLICRFLGHDSDPEDDFYCNRCMTVTGAKRHCVRCGEDME